MGLPGHKSGFSKDRNALGLTLVCQRKIMRKFSVGTKQYILRKERTSAFDRRYSYLLSGTLQRSQRVKAKAELSFFQANEAFLSRSSFPVTGKRPRMHSHWGFAFSHSSTQDLELWVHCSKGGYSGSVATQVLWRD